MGGISHEHGAWFRLNDVCMYVCMYVYIYIKTIWLNHNCSQTLKKNTFRDSYILSGRDGHMFTSRKTSLIRKDGGSSHPVLEPVASPFEFQTGLGKCSNWTSPNDWGYKFQNPQKWIKMGHLYQPLFLSHPFWGWKMFKIWVALQFDQAGKSHVDALGKMLRKPVFWWQFGRQFWGTPNFAQSELVTGEYHTASWGYKVCRVENWEPCRAFSEGFESDSDQVPDRAPKHLAFQVPLYSYLVLLKTYLATISAMLRRQWLHQQSAYGPSHCCIPNLG